MMMELWTWEKAVIKRLSSKYDAPAERLPDDVIDALTAMRDHNRALNQLRYFSMAKSDGEENGKKMGKRGEKEESRGHRSRP